MSDLPPRELLEANHTFPGTFVFKAIGINQNDFADRAVASVRRELGLEADPQFEIKQTAHGRHVSVTITPWVEDAAQVLAIYGQLRQVHGLVMML